MSTAQQAPGETSLSTLLSTLTTTVHPTTYVWVHIPPNHELVSQIPIQMTFREPEGTTIITTKEAADLEGMPYVFPSKRITLNVQSSLEAVGFIAKVSERVTRLGIGVNPVSGYHHDHLFIAEGKEDEVVKALDELAQESKAGVE